MTVNKIAELKNIIINETNKALNEIQSIVKKSAEFEKDYSKIQTQYNEKCIICLEKNIFKDFKEIPCSHVFHEKCIEKWLEKHFNCPMCRFDLRTGIEY
uniref:RING-type domain-containing protein n=1 Tax=Ditylenchus dipsaci TaxID=166011 RepID=A0A915CPD6_9BILA